MKYKWMVLLGLLLAAGSGCGKGPDAVAVDPDIKAVFDAAKTGNAASTRELLAGNPDLSGIKDSEGKIPLHWAAEGDHKEVLELHLQNGADVNSKDNRGNTPLHVAAALGRKDAAETLLKAGASLDAENNNGHTPVKVAADNARNDLTNLLKSGGPAPE